MKTKLLLLAGLCFLSFKGFSQAEAYPVPDLIQCGYEIFDLTVNTPIALGNQDPINFSVTFFETEPDALNNTNAITNPVQYVPNSWMAQLFYRVTNNMNGDYEIGSFTVSVASGWMPEPVEISTCGESYTLPPMEPGFEYYTGPNQTGTQLFAGHVITQTTTVYVYNPGPCFMDDSFGVYIGTPPVANQPSPLLVCTDTPVDMVVNLSSTAAEIVGNLPNVTLMYFVSLADAEAGVNTINNVEAYFPLALPQVIYVRVEDSSGCFDIVELTIEEGGCTDNSLNGSVVYDMNADGCDSSDNGVGGIPVTYTIAGTTNTITTFTSANGEFSFYNLPDGAGFVTVNQGTLYSATPSNQQFIFPATTPVPADFCLTVPNPVNDVAVTLVPISAAQPGFQAFYTIYYENNGALPASGTISLQFDTAHLTYASSSPGMTVSGNTMTLAYSNLQPFQSNWATVIFTVNLPQITPGGTLLNFVATIDPVTGDANPADNTYQMNQMVVNSWDPNDITVHEGEFITEEQADGYLNYTIRFQNKGTANAVNVAVESPIDANLDLSTFEPTASSHNYTATIENGQVTFAFNNINLTWEDNDEMGSQGYVSYRVKPVSTVTIGDDMQGGSAGIFFDFNDPVMTNTVTTTIQALGTEDFATKGFIMYPNPASDNVTLQMANISGKVTVAVTDVLGKVVMNAIGEVNNSAIHMNTSSLTSGMYFITVTAGNTIATQKLFVK
jgi:uncharacterized repeat protein (TIGR01451 family)